MTPRVVEALGEADVIAAEDTRNSIKLLNHFGIATPMTSYHEYNKVEKAAYLISRMKAGETVALVTDAGTPGISDPGEVLVQMCQEEQIPVTSLPGACACIVALTLSGLSARRFCFEGFLPADRRERRKILGELREEVRTIVLYEAPHRLVHTLAELREALGDRRLTLCRELTKKFETVLPTTLDHALLLYEREEPRGEYVLVVEGKSIAEKEREAQERWMDVSLEEHMRLYEEKGLERKEAMKRVAKDRGISRRDVYGKLLAMGECEKGVDK